MRKVELLFHTKTRHCKHKSPDCVTNAVQGLLSNFKIGVKIRLAITLIQIILRGGKINNISLTYQLRFPCFLAAFALVAKLVLCVLRRFRSKDDGLNGFAAGFLAGFTLLINNDQDTRKMFALYLLSRAYGSTQKVLEDRGWFPKIPNQHMIFILIVNVLFVWLYFCEFNTKIPVSFYAAVNNLYTVHKAPNDHIMRNILQ